MGNIFNLDSKFMQVMSKFADLMILNILTLICCIPIITIGASLTAMHNVLLKIYRDEESYVMKHFFKSFKENLKQSTLIMLIYTVLAIFLIIDFMLLRGDAVNMPQFIRYILYIVTILTLISYSWVYVLQSRYENKIRVTIRNSFVVGLSKIFYTIMMLLFDILPLLVLYYFESLLPAIILLGFTIPGFLKTILYSKVFDQLEGVDRKALKAQALEDDGWTVELEEDQIEGTEGEVAAIEAMEEAAEAAEETTAEESCASPEIKSDQVEN